MIQMFKSFKMGALKGDPKNNNALSAEGTHTFKKKSECINTHLILIIQIYAYIIIYELY